MKSLTNRSLAANLFAVVVMLLGVPAPAAHAAGGSEVGNGGGLAEKNVLFAYLNLGSYIDLCLASPACRLSGQEPGILGEIRQGLQDEYRAPSQVSFHSESKEPGFFMIDGQVRIAKTGDTVGSPIYVNTDLLYSKSSSGQYTALDVPTAVSVLVHEMGHHHGVTDETALDLLGSKVETLLLSHLARTQVAPGLAANVIDFDSDSRIDEIVIEHQDDLVDLTSRLPAAVTCYPDSSRMPLAGLRVLNAHWDRGHYDDDTKTFHEILHTWYEAVCVQKTGPNAGSYLDHGDLLIDLSFTTGANGAVAFEPDQTTIRQESCNEGDVGCGVGSGSE